MYRSQLTELRVRARQQLGSDFSQLLGAAHSYDWISPSLIASYIGGGDGRRSGDPLTSRASYADITSAADIYLAGEAFAYPLTLIDTPAACDPFLVRDGIMPSSIDDADAHVVVLSASQTAAKPDSDLLRNVHGLRKDRLVVFINRIDELEDVPRQAPRIVENVRALLQRELNASIPVLAGSVKWASAALGSGRRPEDSLAAAKAASHAKAIGAAAPKELEELARSAADERAEKLGNVLHACSGFPQLYRTLADLLRDSALAGDVREAAVTFATIARQSEGAARSELNVLEESVRTAHHGVMTDSWELHRLRGQVERFDSALVKLDRVYDSRCAALERLRSDAMGRLRQELHDAISDYVERERTAIVFALDRLNKRDGVRFDLSGMRLLLEQAFVARYRKLHDNIVEAEESALQQFQRLIEEEIPNAQINGAATASGSFVYPRMAALSRVGVFDIDPKLWSKWRRRHPAIQDAIAEFERILTTEFLDVAGELAEVAEREGGARAALLIDRLSLTRINAVQTIMKHKAEVQTRLEHMQHALQPQAMERFLGEQIHRLAECRERLVLLVRLGQWLDEFLDRSAAPPQRQVQQAV